MALNAFKNLTADDRFRIMMADREKSDRDKLSQINDAKRDGIREGKADGAHENKIQTAKRLLAKGLKPDFIAEVTGLSEDEIKTLITV